MMNTATIRTCSALALVLGLGLFQQVHGAGAQPDPKAYDVASNYPAASWTNNSNRGTGFGPWTLAVSSGSNGFASVDLADPAARSLVGMLNPSFRMWAHTASDSYVNADRSFSEPMAIGDAFSFKWAFNWSSGTGIKGFRIMAGSTRLVSVTNGSSSAITVNGADTGFIYGTNAMTWTFTYADAATLAVHAAGRDGAQTYSTNVAIGSAPTGFRLFVSGMSPQPDANMRYPYFNEFKVQATAKQDQAITFAEGAWQTRTYGEAAFALVASASSGLPVAFESSDPTVASVSGSTVTIHKVGTATVTASQAGNGSYHAAEPVARTFTVIKANSQVTVWPTATPIMLGQSLADAELIGGVATPAGAFAWTDDTIQPTEAGTFSYGVMYAPGDADNYNPAQNDVSLTVNSPDKQDPEVSEWPTAGAITYGQTLAASALAGGSASVAGTFAWTDDSILPIVGGPAQGVTFHPTDGDAYNAVVGAVAIEVSKADPAVTEWPVAGAITYGQTLAGSVLAGGLAAVPGAFAWTDDTLAPDVGTSDQAVSFTPNDMANYNAAQGAVSVTVGKATPTIETSPTASRIFVGDSLAASTLTGGAASVPGTFAWTDDTVTPARGTANQSATFTPTDGARFDAVTLPVSVTVWYDALTFYVKPATWWSASIQDPEMWGPFVGSWVGHAMTFDSGLGWWKVTVEVSNSTAAITHQLRIFRTSGTKYQKATGNFSANPVFTTTTGEIWIDASADAYTWSGNDFYLESGTTTESIGKASQTITFAAGDWQNKALDDAPFDLVASASSGLPVGFESLNPAVATVSGATVTLVGAGEATIRATQAGNEEFNAAQPVDRVLTVSAPVPGVEFFTVGAESDGQVVVRWRMRSEFGIAGFWLERLDGADWVRINAEIVPAGGGVYEMPDGGALAGETYIYRLVEEQTGGEEQTHGPYGRKAWKLEFLQPVSFNAEGAVLRWQSRVDERYRVLRSANLTLGFEVIASDIPATLPDLVNEFFDEEAGAGGFYGIQVDYE